MNSFVMAERNKVEVLNPFVDWGFKYLFGIERGKRNLMGFLNFLLKTEDPIIDITYLNNENIPLDKDGKECVFDILCEDIKGEMYLIEVQNAGIGYMQNRMIYYACRLIDQMGERGKEWKYDIKKVFSICLMNFTYEQDPVLRRDFVLCEPGTTNIMSDKLNFIMLQLPCLEKVDLEECESFYEKLLYLLIEMKKGMKTIEELKQEVYQHGLNEQIRETFLGVLEDADIASLSPQERKIYDAQLKKYRDNHACLDYAIEQGIRQGIEKGIKKGMEQGLEKGMEQGMVKGMEKGMEKGREQGKLEVAKALIENGVDISIITAATGLSIDEIV